MTFTHYTEAFEGAASGVTVSPSNSIFDTNGGTAVGVFDSANKLFGATAIKWVYSSTFGYQQVIISAGNQTKAFLRIYLYITSAPTGSQSVFIGFLSGSTFRTQLTLTTGGKFNMRSPATLQASGVNDYRGKWIRVEVEPNGTAQTVRIYSGANLHGSTPDETLTGAVTVGTGFDRFRIGSTAADTFTAAADALDVDYTTQPGPIVSWPSDAAYVWDGSALVACDTYWWNGTTLEQVDPYWWDGSTLV